MKYGYQVIDLQTKQVIGTYSTARRARNKADKLDLAYGAVRYGVRQIDIPTPLGQSDKPAHFALILL